MLTDYFDIRSVFRGLLKKIHAYLLNLRYPLSDIR